MDGDGLSITHVYEQNSAGGWDEAVTFEFDSGNNTGNYFIGEELAIDGGVIAVGYGAHSEAGSSITPVQVLERDAEGWFRTFARLSRDPPGTPIDQRRFAWLGPRPAGRTVGVSGDLIIAEEAGATRPDQTGSGVARVFERQGDGSWRETANLFATASSAAGASAVAIDANTAALVYRQSFNEPGAGLYFFERQQNGAWAPTQSFLQDPGEGRRFFFRTIDIDGDIAVTRDFSTGLLTTYERLGGVWSETAGLPSTDSYSVANGGFALGGDLLARTVGGLADEHASIEVWRREAPGEWNLLTTIADPNPKSGLDFGSKIALDGKQLLVGAVWIAHTGFNDPRPPGAAYLFTPVPEPTSLVLAVLAVGQIGRVRRRR